MKSIRAIYEHGVFRPLEPVDLPDGTRVDLHICNSTIPNSGDEGLDKIYETLSLRFNSGQHDGAARHNEHQP